MSTPQGTPTVGRPLRSWKRPPSLQKEPSLLTSWSLMSGLHERLQFHGLSPGTVGICYGGPRTLTRPKPQWNLPPTTPALCWDHLSLGSFGGGSACLTVGAAPSAPRRWTRWTLSSVQATGPAQAPDQAACPCPALWTRPLCQLWAFLVEADGSGGVNWAPPLVSFKP